MFIAALKEQWVAWQPSRVKLREKLFMYTGRNLIYPNGDVASEQRGLF